MCMEAGRCPHLMRTTVMMRSSHHHHHHLHSTRRHSLWRDMGHSVSGMRWESFSRSMLNWGWHRTAWWESTSMITITYGSPRTSITPTMIRWLPPWHPCLTLGSSLACHSRSRHSGHHPQCTQSTTLTSWWGVAALPTGKFISFYLFLFFVHFYFPWLYC